VYYKRLEKGTYEMPASGKNNEAFSITHEALQYILQGVSLKSVRKRKRYQQMAETYIITLPKSTIGKVLGYSTERRPELMIYASDGKLNIDNNPVESSIRPVAIGRKNYLFAASHEATQRSAMLYSFLGTCKLNGINPFIWLQDILCRISNHPINKIEELLPQNWNPLAQDFTLYKFGCG